MLILWYNSDGTVQRLSNALATGVPVIARTWRTYTDTFGQSGILLADNFTHLSELARALQRSRALRQRVSNAGVVAASMFSRANISNEYKQFLKMSRAKIRPGILPSSCPANQRWGMTRAQSTTRDSTAEWQS